MRFVPSWPALLAAVPVAMLAPVLGGCGDAGPAPSAGAAGAEGAAVESPAPGESRSSAGLDLSGVGIPDEPIAGRVAGAPFALDVVEVHEHSGAIVFRSADGQVVYLFLGGLDLENIPSEGYTLEIIRPRIGADQPHVHLHYPDPTTGDVLRQAVFTEGYTLRLRITPADGAASVIGLVLRVPTDPLTAIAGVSESD